MSDFLAQSQRGQKLVRFNWQKLEVLQTSPSFLHTLEKASTGNVEIKYLFGGNMGVKKDDRVMGPKVFPK